MFLSRETVVLKVTTPEPFSITVAVLRYSISNMRYINSISNVDIVLTALVYRYYLCSLCTCTHDLFVDLSEDRGGKSTHLLHRDDEYAGRE